MCVVDLERELPHTSTKEMQPLTSAVLQTINAQTQRSSATPLSKFFFCFGFLMHVAPPHQHCKTWQNNMRPGNCFKLTRNLSLDFACNCFATKQCQAEQLCEGYINHFAASAYTKYSSLTAFNQQPFSVYMVVFDGVFVHCVSMQHHTGCLSCHCDGTNHDSVHAAQ